MTKVIIIEDEKPAARRLQRMLSRLNIETETMLHSVAEAVNWFNSNDHPDLIFLDIQLSDGISFEIFEKVEINSAVIFTTAYDEYALKAFKLNSVDYLLKPIDEEELANAVAKFKENYLKNSPQIDFNAFRKILETGNKPDYKIRFTIQVGQHLKIIPANEICCFYSENKASYLTTTSGRNYPVDVSLENLEKELNPEKFFRINRKSIVNIDCIEDIISYTNSRLEIKVKAFNEFQLIVSRERVRDFKNWIS
ncbi:LytTR family DNA-binding domain-containing protein [Salegentibacter mishustinae]|uniref:LytR/AlgR family response regulator transcription factor n=1 Tax=Salegentibacter mishustinae TaxID=270918 RepID=UPI001CE1E9D8|nr:LytTR family DNA-binding domain-containing protein [Salegentibacter mishustinae]UBZ06003.1 LytTR family DNA-binding domain-containing protein [Salegentibacter mishustinae]